MQRDLLEKILKQAKQKADQAELLFDETEGTSVHFENNRLKSIETKQSAALGLRVIQQGRIGFSSTSDLSPDAVGQMIENAIFSSDFGQEAAFSFPAPAKANAHPKLFDKKVTDWTMEQGVALGQGILDRLQPATPGLMIGVSVDPSSYSRRLLNSAGLYLEEQGTNFSIGASGIQAKEGSFLWLGHGVDSNDLTTETAEIETVIQDDYRHAQTACDFSGGKTRLILCDDALSLLLSSLFRGINGKTLQKKISPLQDKLGQKIVSDLITLEDDPTLDFRPSSGPFDGEGLPTQKRTLLEKGVLNGFLFDLQTAGLTGNKSTGNAARGASTQPAPSTHNVVLKPGTMSLEKMIRETKRGLLVKSTMGGHTGNPLAGEFSVSLELAFLIENGEIAGRVKDCMLAGNAYDILSKNLVALEDRLHWSGGHALPYALLDDLTIAAE